MDPSRFLPLAALFFILSTIECFPAYPDCSDTIYNSYECAVYLENQLSQQHSGLFARKGSRLEIKLTNGKTKTYLDKAEGKHYDGRTMAFSLVKYFPEIGYGLVHVQYYEDDTYYMLNLRNGRDKDIEGFPVLSPDRKRIAVYHEDIDPGYNQNILAVYRVGAVSPVKEFRETSREWGPSEVKWIGNNRISFVKKLEWDDDGQPKMLKYHERRWQIE